MFKRKFSETYNTTVTVLVPNEKGKFDKMSFTGTFKRVKRSELEELSEKLGKMKNLELVERVFVGWGDDMVDDKDQPIPYSKEELLATAEDCVQLLPAIAETFWNSIFNVREKN